jgi:hypothetical protein
MLGGVEPVEDVQVFGFETKYVVGSKFEPLVYLSPKAHPLPATLHIEEHTGCEQSETPDHYI